MSKIQMIEKENPPRIKEEFSVLRITVTPNNPNVKISPAARKPAELKIPKPLVEKVEGPFNEKDELVEEMEVGKTYIFKATKFKKSSFTPIKHIWWAEEIDDNGKITDLEYRKGENPYLDDKGVVCFKYEAKECEKVRIYAYVAKPIKKVSIESKVILKKIVAFFIGGASDKEGFYGMSKTEIMLEVKDNFKKRIESNSLLISYKDIYLGYNDVRGEDDIKNKVLSEITNKDKLAVYIIGHSLGGWNGAHLSKILTDKGYNVDLLITLDPVGTGVDAKLFSDIYKTAPKPKANYWINISSSPENYQIDDFVADYGGQWKPKTGMQINYVCDCNHGSANFMFTKHLKDTNISASDMLLELIKQHINK